MGIEVHQRANSHVALVTIQFEVLIRFYWGIVSKEIILLLVS